MQIVIVKHTSESNPLCSLRGERVKYVSEKYFPAPAAQQNIIMTSTDIQRGMWCMRAGERENDTYDVDIFVQTLPDYTKTR